MIALRLDRFDEAETAYDSLTSRYKFEEILRLIPVDLRERILDAYASPTRSLGFYRSDPRRVLKAERALAIADYFNGPEPAPGWLRWNVLRALHVSDNPDDRARALRLAEQITRDPSRPEAGVDNQQFVLEACWLLRNQGEPARALALADRWLYQSPGTIRKGLTCVLLERASAHHDLGRWEEAESDIEDLFRLALSQDLISYHGRACLIRGLVRSHRGEETGALEAWKQGIPPEDQVQSLNGMETLNAIILGALTGDLTDPKAESILNGMVASLGSDSPIAKFRALLNLPPSLLRDAWRSPRGRRCAEAIAFHSVPLDEFFRLPAILLATEIVRQSALPPDAAEEQVDVVWGMAEEGFRSYLAGKIGQAQLIPLGLAWKRGVTGPFGWAGVAPTLEPRLRGPAAYVFGQRCRRLGKPNEAVHFFRAALADAPEGSPLARLSRAEIERVGSR